MLWSTGALGIACCVAGVYLFNKNSFEEGKSVRPAIILMIIGVCIIGWVTAKEVGLVE